MTSSLRFLNSYLLDGQLSFWGRGHGAVVWSNDNQVVIVHKKGVHIYECQQSPGVDKRSQVLTTQEVRIDGPGRIYPPNTGDVDVSELMNSPDRHIVFELMKDPILRPHGYDSTLWLNYFIKADWSTAPVYGGMYNECRCILGVLTSCHQLVIYGKTNRRYLTTHEWKEPSETLINLTWIYNKILLDEWKKSSQKYTGSEGKFNCYKNRLYELAIIDFIWLPDWKLGPDLKSTDETKGVFKTFLMTFHANGDACMWRIKASKTIKPHFSANLLYKKNIIHNDTVSCASYSLVSEALGLLVVGTNKGRLKAFRLEKRSRVKVEIETGEPFHKYVIHEGEDLWGEDMLRVESILLKPESSGRTKVNIMAIKHPNLVVGSMLSVLCLKVLSENFIHLKVPGGPGCIVGFVENAEGQFLALRDSGVISVIIKDKNELKYLPESEYRLFDPAKIKRKKTAFIGTPVQKLDRPKKKERVPDEKRLLFQGMGISPNKTMLCVGRTMGMYYDHLRIRRPSHIVFLSLLPKDGMWTHVQRLYYENKFSLRAISDVLVPFRSYLKGHGHEKLYEEIMQWGVGLKDKSISELRLLYWCLKIQPGATHLEKYLALAEKQYNPRAMRRLEAFEKLNRYRVDVVADRIMQHRCASLIRVVAEHQEEASFSLDVQVNKQCLKAMYEFLESKAEKIPLPTKPEFDPLPLIPICYWCKGPIEFPLEPEDELADYANIVDEMKVDFDSEKLTGFKWNSRRHPVKEFGVHLPEICILSLVPLKFPYRKCSCCGVHSLMKPAFGQRPFCPLCNSYMYPILLPVKGHEATQEKDIIVDYSIGNQEAAELAMKEELQERYSQETAEAMDLCSFQTHPRRMRQPEINIQGEVGDDWADDDDGEFQSEEEIQLHYESVGTFGDSDDSSSSEEESWYDTSDDGDEGEGSDNAQESSGDEDQERSDGSSEDDDGDMDSDRVCAVYSDSDSD